MKDNSHVLSYTDAAEQLLRAAGKPQKYSDLMTEALARGLVESDAQRPSVSMYIALRNEIDRRDKAQEKQRFVFQGKGIFDLADRFIGEVAKKTKSALDQIKASREEAKMALYDALTSKNSGDHFEAMVADLLIKMGYSDVQVIGGKDDQGVDIICSKRNGISLVRYAIQCKCKKLQNEIGPKDISNLRDNLSTYQCQEGVFVTTSRLNDAAKKKAREAGKELIQSIEHDEILELFAEHQVGIRAETIRFYQVDASSYEFLGGVGKKSG